jgi:hypothetical protein
MQETPMNRTLIVLVTLSLGALLPAPAQAEGPSTVEISAVCTSDLMDALGPAWETPLELKHACVSGADCDGDASYGVAVNGQARCVGIAYQLPDCVPEASAMQASASGSAGAGSSGVECPSVESCPGGQAGLVVGAVAGCIATPSSLCLGTTACDGGPSPSSGPDCEDTDQDNRIGGSDATCIYTCPEGAVLVIAVHAHDAQATASGSTSCGGATASCDFDTQSCAKPSERPTSRRQANVECNGSSDEFWGSDVTVVCSAVGADVASILCRVDPDYCEGILASASSSSSVDFCLLENAADADVLAPMLETAFQTIALAQSFVVFRVSDAGGFAVRFQAEQNPDGSAMATCQTQWF